MTEEVCCSCGKPADQLSLGLCEPCLRERGALVETPAAYITQVRSAMQRIDNAIVKCDLLEAQRICRHTQSIRVKGFDV